MNRTNQGHRFTIWPVFLIIILLTGCLPRTRSHTATTAAPYADESGVEYEHYEEQRQEEQSRFSQLEQELFQQEVSHNLIDLHFSLKNPEAAGISQAQSLYGSLSPESVEEKRQSTKALEEELDTFDIALLSEDQKLTLRILKSILNTENMADGLELYTQTLVPTIGIQSQLPILLCEYSFYRTSDVEDYLKLLEGIKPYFEEILQFEQLRADAGLMTSDTTLDHVIEACESYLLVPGDNFMTSTFQERLGTLTELTEEEKNQFLQRHEQILEEYFVPAYQLLIDGLEKFKGTGTNDKGMCGYPKGKEYYEYMVLSNTGTSYQSLDELIEVIDASIKSSLKESSQLLNERPELENLFFDYRHPLTDPDAIMEDLKQQTSNDFPALPACSYTIKEVPKALEPFLSPAFYVVSPIDDVENNIIYINKSPQFSEDTLYATMAHEGYPGHLYQNVYFHSKNSSNLRKILSFSGYSEGWATYVEYLSHTTDKKTDPDLGRLLSVNSKASLGLHAYLDLAVNYLGWDQKKISDYLSQYYTDTEELSESLFRIMVETPGNYLPYFVGYLEIDNMRKTAEAELGSRFDAKAFHTFILDMGNAPFDVIQPYFTSWLMDQKL